MRVPVNGILKKRTMTLFLLVQQRHTGISPHSCPHALASPSAALWARVAQSQCPQKAVLSQAHSHEQQTPHCSHSCPHHPCVCPDLLGILKTTLSFNRRTHRTEKSCYIHGCGLACERIQIKIGKDKTYRVQERPGAGFQLSSSGRVIQRVLSSPEPCCPGFLLGVSHIDMIDCLGGWSVSSPSKGQADTTWLKAPSISQAVGIDYLG